jgi:hypothetical protein
MKLLFVCHHDLIVEERLQIPKRQIQEHGHSVQKITTPNKCAQPRS